MTRTVSRHTSGPGKQRGDLMSSAMNSASTFVTKDGVSLRVTENAMSSAEITVVLVHGWTLASQTWDRVASGLAEQMGKAVRIVRFDLRGHGESDPAPPGTATIEQCADDLAELITELVPHGDVVLAGHSMGGMTIMALAEQHPELFRDRVAGVALVASSAGGLKYPKLGLPGPVSAASNRIERDLVRKRLSGVTGRRVSKNSRWLRPGLRWLLFGREAVKADVAASAEWVGACHPASMAGFRSSLANHDRYRALAVLRSVPVVVMAGLADRLTPASHARRMVAELPEADLLAYADAGHMLPLERTDEVTARIAALTRQAANN